ncbi:uncharacterized protein LOC130086900 isoform X2 [Rhinichthys klamathensis goyatoka]|nr:uncharacterized protein LOC130086900 isoform X2 [Rhinichthys klamathensis goyatoka]
MLKGKTFVFLWLYFCRLDGVFADDLKSVMEGESVTLQINAAEIQRNDVINWRFGTNGPLIAKTSGDSGEINMIPNVPDGRFRDRLKLDKKTGSLTIMNIRPDHAGVYEVDISRSPSSTYRFTVTVNGVFADGLKSVMEGDSVTLKINAAEIQRNDVIKWRFGTNGPLIAKTDGVTSEVFYGPNMRFRDRLDLDEKTGSLTIIHPRTEHYGVYEVEISRSISFSTHRFTVTVYAPIPDPVTSRDPFSSSSGLPK